MVTRVRTHCYCPDLHGGERGCDARAKKRGAAWAGSGAMIERFHDWRPLQGFVIADENAGPPKVVCH